MKKSILAVFAVIVALAFSAFTTPKFADVYLVYVSGAQDDVAHYSQVSSASPIEGSDVLAWLKVADSNNGIIDQSEFNAVFNPIDDNNDNSLDDEPEIAGVFEKKPD